MILNTTYTSEHLHNLHSEYSRKVDIHILERTVFAFGLLEALVRTGLPFIFKGGTSLILLCGTLKRLSTDIDITVSPDTEVDTYLDEISTIFPFLKKVEDERVPRNNIVKRHIKYFYTSPLTNKENYILLDILFEENHYTNLINKPINIPLLLTEGENYSVFMPDVGSILADKLTAFAPHTTGILINTGKDMEIIKQLYDITTLLNMDFDQEEVINTYPEIAETECMYRDLHLSPSDILMDTLKTSLCICSKGKLFNDKNEYENYRAGIAALRTHIFQAQFNPDTIAEAIPKLIYFLVCMLTNSRYTNNLPETDRKFQFGNSAFGTIRYIQKINPTAFAYLVKADNLINQDNELKQLLFSNDQAGI